MKLLKKIAEFFTGKERTAQKEQEPTGSETTNSSETACMVSDYGTTENPLFAPQPLLSWYVLQKAFSSRGAVCGDISQVKLLDLFHPLTKKFITTVFAIKDKKGYFWGEIGTDAIYFSEKDAFIYRPAKTFRVFLCPRQKKRIVAICRYKKYQIIVEKLIEEPDTSSTNADTENIIPCPLLPCSLHKAAEFVMKP